MKKNKFKKQVKKSNISSECNKNDRKSEREKFKLHFDKIKEIQEIKKLCLQDSDEFYINLNNRYY